MSRLEFGEVGVDLGVSLGVILLKLCDSSLMICDCFIFLL